MAAWEQVQFLLSCTGSWSSDGDQEVQLDGGKDIGDANVDVSVGRLLTKMGARCVSGQCQGLSSTLQICQDSSTRCLKAETHFPLSHLWPGVESLWHHSSLQVRPARPFRLKEISRKKDRKHFSLFCNQSSERNILFQIEKLSGIGMQLTSTTGIPRWWWQWWHQCCDDNDALY